MTAITVRDGRAGRDPSKVTPEGGEILMQYAEADPAKYPDVGHRLVLPDGTEVEVIGIDETIKPNASYEIVEHTITAFIDDVFEGS